MKDKIRKIGTIQEIDGEGYIENNLSLDNIQPRYQIIIDDTLEFYKIHFKEHIHSIYLRGSVPKGKAIPHISDLDTLAISHTEINENQHFFDRITSFRDEMSNKYPYLNGLEIDFKSLETARSDKMLQFRLKTQCISIYGKDIIKELPKFGVAEAYRDSKNIEEGITNVKSWLKQENPKEILEIICSWIMKRTVRIGFELVMEKEQCYTRDLYPCYEMFAKNYPNKSKEMREALNLAVFPTSDMDYMWKVLLSINDFLIEEAKKNNFLIEAAKEKMN